MTMLLGPEHLDLFRPYGHCPNLHRTTLKIVRKKVVHASASLCGTRIKCLADDISLVIEV
jgi:hypothetical protein